MYNTMVTHTMWKFRLTTWSIIYAINNVQINDKFYHWVGKREAKIIVHYIFNGYRRHCLNQLLLISPSFRRNGYAFKWISPNRHFVKTSAPKRHIFSQSPSTTHCISNEKTTRIGYRLTHNRIDRLLTTCVRTKESIDEEPTRLRYKATN